MKAVNWSFGRLPRVRHEVPSAERSAREAARWLCRAQDATADDGVAAYFDRAKNCWASSYPETTGYIIPTFFQYTAWSGDSEYRQRASRMAAWESCIQLANGGVRAGLMSEEEPHPTVFNTGQVLFGWLSAWEAEQDIRYRASMIKAADWLISIQERDGAWRSFGSPFAAFKINTYNTRVAYGLAKVGKALGESRYIDAAKANVSWALTQAESNGWLRNNDLEDNARPLTHTIAYSIRGILEVGLLADEPHYVEVAEKMARQVLASQRRDGALPGRLDCRWHPAVRWSCLTGNAQMAIIWLLLFRAFGDAHWRNAARGAIRFVQSTQDCCNRNAGILGGIAGSHPISGEYMRRRYPNWAAKFFIDAILLAAELGVID